MSSLKFHFIVGKGARRISIKLFQHNFMESPYKLPLPLTHTYILVSRKIALDTLLFCYKVVFILYLCLYVAQAKKVWKVLHLIVVKLEHYNGIKLQQHKFTSRLDEFHFGCIDS